jgi:hypothetical protein
MTNCELVFDNRQKRRYDGASGEIYVPEAPEEQKEKYFHGRSLADRREYYNLICDTVHYLLWRRYGNR